ncbi:MAG: acetyl-CoA carboxylase biotin carboxyl carrier protein [Clostridia bacterium]|nr:acetyl-CoA carboxylase biotin carboxyl carrier protein [Clostridia bacterium]
MEYEKIKQLIEDMGNSKLSSIEIDFPDGTKINMKKQEVVTVSNNAPIVEVPIQQVTPNVQEEKVEIGNIVKSPMVGTFYSKPSLNSNPYVEVGKKVKKGDVLCIIEAMKLMNEIESEFDGEIQEILVKDGEAVEYGKPLFRIG